MMVWLRELEEHV